MAIVGVVCEYNPFHNGHAKQFRLIRDAFGDGAAIVCLMSGNYVQRGEPALFEKSVRARAAIECGADLVLELPITYALRSAEGFADGGVEILSKLGVDILCFGSECGDTDRLAAAAATLLTPEFEDALRSEIKTGVSFAAARERAMLRCGDAEVLRRPNDILAVEYCKAILRRGSRIRPFTVTRCGDYHKEQFDTENPSAASLRRKIACGEPWRDSVPKQAAELYSAADRFSMRAGERAVLARLRTLDQDVFEALPYGSEGLWRKFMAACRTEQSVEQILTAVKSKRYARARLQRMLMCAFLGLSAETLQVPAPYVRVLAFNDCGRSVLQQAKKRLLTVNAGAAPANTAYYSRECVAADLFSLFCESENGMIARREQKSRIFYLHFEKNTCKIQ